MHVAEQIRSGERSIAQADELEREVQKHPIARVQSRADGSFEADFVLDLKGVAHDKVDHEIEIPNKDKRAERYIGMFLASLSKDEALEFVYRWDDGSGGDAQFRWFIRGRCLRRDRELAAQGVLDLYRGLSIALEASSNAYQFTPAADQPFDEASSSWCYEVHPLGLLVPAAKLRFPGFASSLGISGSIRLPLLADATSTRFNASITGGACYKNVSITISVESMSLSASAVAVISAVRTNLREEKIGQLEYQASVDGHVLDDGILHDALAQLEKWLSDPRGYRVRCVVAADEPIPQPFLELVGHELFSGSPVTADIAGQESPASEDNVDGDISYGVLDLGNCFHRTSDPSGLFPELTTLATLGIGRAYGPAPVNLPEHGLRLGRCGYGHRVRDVRILQSDRSRHCYIVGATGTGKSTLLHNMVLQDIENGEGVCLIDPHGDLFHQVLHSVPEERAKDVILMDLCDFDHVVGLNFLECSGPYKSVQMNFIVNEMMMIFHRLYDMEKAGGPMFEMYMRNALLLVMDSDASQATLLDVVRVFEDEVFRRFAKSQCRNPMVVSFWDNQAEKAGGEAALRNIAPYITSKLNQFTHNALLRPIIGQSSSTIDFRHLMDNRKTLLINLSKGLLGEMDVQLIGMLLMGKIFNAALSRISQAPESRRPYYLYVDEFQNFTTPTIASLLSEARKFGLNLTLANQNLGQFSSSEKNRSIVETVLGNVATTLFFRMGPKDTGELETYTAPYLDSHGMQYLPDYHVVCRMLNRNAPSTPFVFSTLPPQSSTVSPATQEGIVEGIRRRCQGQYAVRREHIESEIMKCWAAPDKSQETAKAH